MTANAKSKAQQWLLMKWDKHYVIINPDSGKVLDDQLVNGKVRDDQLELVQINLWDYEGAPKQQWSIEKWLGQVTDGFQRGDYSVIRSRSNGLVLEIGGFLYPHSPGSPDQLWELIPVK